MNVQPFRGIPDLASVTTLVVAVLSIGLAVRSGKGQPGNPTARVPEQPECPYDTHIPVDANARGARTPPTASIPLSGPITHIPEFHDCQRFVVPGTGQGEWKYDSLYAIFAALHLEAITPRESLEVPVATILSYGGTYLPLGIKPDTNCLVLKREADHWTARMVPIANASCRNRTPRPNEPSKSLEVREVPVVGPARAVVYPGAARWDWDPRNHEQYIGITCGDAWCEVGDSGFKSADPYPGPEVVFDPLPEQPVPHASPLRVMDLRGSYDAQVLDSLLDGRHVPTNVWGWLIPNPALTTDPEPDFRIFRAGWVHVSSAWLNGNYKWNLTEGMNKIYLCHRVPGGVDRCKVPLMQSPRGGSHARHLSKCSEDEDDHGTWWAMVKSAAGTVQYSCVVRISHRRSLEAFAAKDPGSRRIRIPVAARWRWMPHDAGEWAKCGMGCCTGQ